MQEGKVPIISGKVSTINNKLLSIKDSDEETTTQLHDNIRYKEVKINELKGTTLERKISHKEIKAGNDICIYFKKEGNNQKIDVIKKFIVNKRKEPNIKIYPSLINDYIKNPEKIITEKSSHIRINFFLPEKKIDKKKYGEKIKKLIKALKSKKINFKVYPIPPCFYVNFEFFYYKKNGHPPAFKDENAIAYFESYNDEKSNKLTLKEYCKDCSFRAEKKCQGIFCFYDNDLLPVMEKIKYISKKIDNNKPIKVLDCGSGYNPSLLDFYQKKSSSFEKIYLLDPEKESLIASKEYIKNNDKFYFLNKEAEEMIFDKNYFDIILMRGSYHHIKDLDVVIRKINKFIKKDGVLLVSDTIYEETKSSHIRNHSLSEAKNTFEKFNFNITNSLSSKDGKIWFIKAITNKR